MDATSQVFSSVNYLQTGAINALDMLNTLLKVTNVEKQQEKIKSLINSFEKDGENARFLSIKDEIRQDVYETLQMNGINAVIYDVPNEEGEKTNLVIFSKDDEALVKICINEVMNEKSERHQVSLSELNDSHFQKSLTSIKGFDKYQIDNLKYYLNKTQVPYAIEKADNGKYKIHFPSNKKPTIDRLLLKSSLDLSGDRGEIKKRLIDEKLKNQSLINEALEKGESFWVVDAFNTDINQMVKTQITPQEYISYKGTHAVPERCSAKSPDFKEKLSLLLDERKDLVFLTNGEYTNNLTKLKTIVEGKATHKKIKKKLKQMDEKEKKVRELIEAKLTRIDMDEQKKMINGLYNNEISVNEFFEIDKLNKEENADIIEFFDMLEDRHELKIELLDRIEGSIHSIETLEITDYYVQNLSIEGLIDHKQSEIEQEHSERIEQKQERTMRIGLPERI